MAEISKKEPENDSKNAVEKFEASDNRRIGKLSSENAGESAVIPVIEEFATVSKEVVETGRVNISKKIREYEETIDEPLFQEQVKVEHVPVNEFVETAPQIRKDGTTTIIPVVEERLVIEKRLFVVEEIHVRKELFQIHQPQQVTLRKEEVEITQLPIEQTPQKNN